MNGPYCGWMLGFSAHFKNYFNLQSPNFSGIMNEVSICWPKKELGIHGTWQQKEEEEFQSLEVREQAPSHLKTRPKNVINIARYPWNTETWFFFQPYHPPNDAYLSIYTTLGSQWHVLPLNVRVYWPCLSWHCDAKVQIFWEDHKIWKNSPF